MESDTFDDNYSITLQDVDGLVVGLNTLKINSGNKIRLDVTNFTMDLPTNTTYRNRTNRELTGSTPYASLIGEHTFSGINNLKIKIDGIIWYDDADNQRNSIGSPMTIQHLQNIRVFNHKLYLKDYHGTDTNIQTPIYSLCTKVDLLGNLAGGANGLPVVVTSISNIRRGNDSVRGSYITYSMELEEDK